ncbi:DUF1534 domain-containing protein [Pseudomonas coronafaciens pv. oryzae str. 1_6]|nr:DUF1534 domain-containing protein [Pseudomonas coronafaciens pv. oryzae str. 1_6]
MSAGADAERGNDRCSYRHLSFLTLQRGNAVRDARRHLRISC